MRLDEIKSMNIFVDTNVFYLYIRESPVYVNIVEDFLIKAIQGTTKVYTSVLVMDELHYRLMLGLIKDNYPGNPLDTLRIQREEVIKQFSSTINEALRKLVMTINLNMIDIQRSDFDSMLGYIEDYAILPRDALHVSVMIRLGIQDIASDDLDFDRVSVIQRHWVFQKPI